MIMDDAPGAAEGLSLAAIAAKLTPAELALVLGLRPAPLSTRARLDRRDVAVRALAAELSGWRPCRAAMRIEADLRQYAGTGWVRERDLHAVPSGADPRRSLLHAVLRLNNGETIGWRQIVNILNGCRSG